MGESILESIGVSDVKEESTLEDNFLKTMRFTGERYEVALPWKDERPLMDTDYDLCYNRLWFTNVYDRVPKVVEYRLAKLVFG